MVIDGRAHAKATGLPSGVAQFTLQHFDVPGQLTVDHGATASSGAPTAEGLKGESTSVLRGITIAKTIKIDSVTSTATALMPASSGETTAVGRTVVQGASVNGVPVEIGDTGIRVSDQAAQGTAQKAQLDEQVSKGLASASIEDIRLARASIVKGDNGKVLIDAPALVVKYRDKTVAGSNPQGFSGGGFGLGGATLSLEGQRATSNEGGGDGYGAGSPQSGSEVRGPDGAAWRRPGPAAGGDPRAARPQRRGEVDAPAAHGRRPSLAGWLRSID
jgi:hypothetical protein